jgi:hypothetical protein
MGYGYQGRFFFRSSHLDRYSIVFVEGLPERKNYYCYTTLCELFIITYSACLIQLDPGLCAFSYMRKGREITEM